MDQEFPASMFTLNPSVLKIQWKTGFHTLCERDEWHEMDNTGSCILRISNRSTLPFVPEHERVREKEKIFFFLKKRNHTAKTEASWSSQTRMRHTCSSNPVVNTRRPIDVNIAFDSKSVFIHFSTRGSLEWKALLLNKQKRTEKKRCNPLQPTIPWLQYVQEKKSPRRYSVLSANSYHLTVKMT